jgi:hypothetical protein
MTHARLPRAMLAAVLLVVVAVALAMDAKISAPIDTPPAQLKPGEFIWAPGVAPAGPLVMVISLDEQLAYVYRNGLRIGVSTVSTGKKGRETPTGVFTILQKQVEHYSTLYDSAPMPYMQRLTWDGVALHAGHLPGYPASHGCVRMPYEFARLLYDVTNFGMTVVVASEARQYAELAHPGLFAPSVPGNGETAPPTPPRLSWFQAYQWAPEKSLTGPLTVLVSTASRRVLVLRNGVEIGRAKIGVAGESLLGTQAYVLLAGNTGAPSQVLPDRPGLLWQSIPLPGYAARPGASLDVEAVKRVSVAPEFAELVYDQLVPGTTLVLTDAPILPESTGEALTVLSAGDRDENERKEESQDERQDERHERPPLPP